jgi:hypothetical protein
MAVTVALHGSGNGSVAVALHGSGFAEEFLEEWHENGRMEQKPYVQKLK